MKTASISLVTAFCAWAMAAVYSHFMVNNPLLKPDLGHPSLAIRILFAIQWVSLLFPVCALIFCVARKPTPNQLEIVKELMRSFSILWPLLVFVAWGIQNTPLIGLNGLK